MVTKPEDEQFGSLVADWNRSMTGCEQLLLARCACLLPYFFSFGSPHRAILFYIQKYIRVLWPKE